MPRLGKGCLGMTSWQGSSKNKSFRIGHILIRKGSRQLTIPGLEAMIIFQSEDVRQHWSLVKIHCKVAKTAVLQDCNRIEEDRSNPVKKTTFSSPQEVTADSSHSKSKSTAVVSNECKRFNMAIIVSNSANSNNLQEEHSYSLRMVNL